MDFSHHLSFPPRRNAPGAGSGAAMLPCHAGDLRPRSVPRGRRPWEPLGREGGCAGAAPRSPLSAGSCPALAAERGLWKEKLQQAMGDWSDWEPTGGT